MKALYLSIFLSVLFVLNICTVAFCLTDREIIQLKKAGVSDLTILEMVKEKTVETCAFSVPEILKLKKAGLSDMTIRVFIRERSFLKDVKPIIYGREFQSIKLVTVKDLIELKNAGVNDEILRAIVVCGSASSEEKDRQNAWEMLKNAGVIVDTRGIGE